MDWKVDRASKKPIYKQIADFIEQGISTGEFSSESLLPSERVLAKALGVNRSTIVTAYDELHSHGIVERIKGSGTRISTNIWGVSTSASRTGGAMWKTVLFYLTCHLFNRFNPKVEKTMSLTYPVVNYHQHCGRVNNSVRYSQTSHF